MPALFTRMSTPFHWLRTSATVADTSRGSRDVAPACYDFDAVLPRFGRNVWPSRPRRCRPETGRVPSRQARARWPDQCPKPRPSRVPFCRESHASSGSDSKERAGEMLAGSSMQSRYSKTDCRLRPRPSCARHRQRFARRNHAREHASLQVGRRDRAAEAILVFAAEQGHAPLVEVVLTAVVDAAVRLLVGVGRDVGRHDSHVERQAMLDRSGSDPSRGCSAR